MPPENEVTVCAARILMRQEGEAPFIVDALKEVLGASQVDLETGAQRLDIGAIRGLRITGPHEPMRSRLTNLRFLSEKQCGNGAQQVRVAAQIMVAQLRSLWDIGRHDEALDLAAGLPP